MLQGLFFYCTYFNVFIIFNVYKFNLVYMNQLSEISEFIIRYVVIFFWMFVYLNFELLTLCNENLTTYFKAENLQKLYVISRFWWQKMIIQMHGVPK